MPQPCCEKIHAKLGNAMAQYLHKVHSSALVFHYCLGLNKQETQFPLLCEYITHLFTPDKRCEFLNSVGCGLKLLMTVVSIAIIEITAEFNLSGSCK